MRLSNKEISVEGLDVFVLCGGLGTRLRSVLPKTPKVLAPIGKITFLDRLLTNLVEQGFTRIILGLGYLADKVEKHLEKKGWLDRSDVKIVTSKEEEPLGTAGAVAHAAPLIKTDHVIVINGDTLTSLDFGQAFDFHRERSAAVTVLATPRPSGNNFGRIVTTKDQKFAGFTQDQPKKGEKTLVGSGAYIMRRDVIQNLPQIPRSIEKDLLPSLGASCHVFETPHDFLDIGTPERYEQAQRLG